MENIKHKTDILVEALPWIQQFKNAIVVIKYGGNAMVSDQLRATFALDVVFLKAVGIKPVIVHGGGPQISQMLSQLGISSEFKDGVRVTTSEAMDVVRMVLTGKVSRELIGLINEATTKKTGYAVGMSGEDGALFQAKPLTDLGHVGEIVNVDPSAVLDLIKAGRIPVISSIAPDVNDHTRVLNINADLAASALAGALNCEKLVILTDVEGLYSDFPNKDSLITEIKKDDAYKMIPNLVAGMIPKIKGAVQALDQGVRSVHLIDGRREHALLEEIFTTKGVGTKITS